MNRRLVALLAAAMAAAPAGTGFAFQNEPDGFRGVSWGQEISRVPELAYTCWQASAEESVKAFHESLDYRVYERKDDDLRIGSVALSGIRYLAWQGRLRSVVVTLKPAEKDDLLKILAARYGKARQERRGAQAAQVWSGEKTTMELVDEGKGVELRMVSTRLAQEERKNRREHAVRHMREKEELDRKAIEEGTGF